uniref:Uncharacterized protein n=1 Tax=Chaetoceros debilis TaxID=122233 RepID=A0A7S3PX80_9STRA|mmetsp:Transcript_27603/g.40744  ORF Transcript_27603/g.40744 Transcript_27603/m.40744 type:complete len:294 (+) Transcript_27603:55-936(+)
MKNNLFSACSIGLICLCLATFTTRTTEAFSLSNPRGSIAHIRVPVSISKTSSSLRRSDKKKTYRRRRSKNLTSQAYEDEEEERSRETLIAIDPLIQETSTNLRRITWFSWWSQVILTVVSSVTLLFARAVLKTSSGAVAGLPSVPSVSGGFVFAGSGVSLSFLSIIWTWGGTRLSRRLIKKKKNYSQTKVANMIRRTITIGATLNLFGMFVTLIGAQAIVGLLASKLLSMQGVTNFGITAAAVSAQTLQPIDILVVQANTNLLLSHFVSLVCCLVMTNSVRKLDPPSEEDDPR